jgi:hypothetical protein
MAGFVKGKTLVGSNTGAASKESSGGMAALEAQMDTEEEDTGLKRVAVPDSVFGRKGAEHLRKRMRGAASEETEGEEGALGALERFKRMKASRGN